jgi:hypothetical protein
VTRGRFSGRRIAQIIASVLPLTPLLLSVVLEDGGEMIVILFCGYFTDRFYRCGYVGAIFALVFQCVNLLAGPDFALDRVSVVVGASASNTFGALWARSLLHQQLALSPFFVFGPSISVISVGCLIVQDRCQRVRIPDQDESEDAPCLLGS